MRRCLALVACTLVAAACSKPKEPDRFPLGAAPAVQATEASDQITGTILEQVAASPYVYLKLKTSGGEVWAAVNETPVTVGASVTVFNAMLMQQFASKSLNRTFDRIYFGSLESPGAMASGMAGSDAPQESVGTPQAVDAKVAPVAKATGPDARTISELWAAKDGLAGKSVTLRGVVVKYNAGVMGKNWLHLQDGSGDAAKGTHDITVTSLGESALGATVTITGTVRTKRDFGAGYAYPLIVEDAKIVTK